MNRFYIKEISAYGPGKKASTISLKDGVNIIFGPSNTGKSYVVACINFMFGASDIPFSASGTGYDRIRMVLQSTDDEVIHVERKIREGPKGEIGENMAYVDSTSCDIESKEYRISTFEYSDLLLRLIGIKERHRIISTQACKSQNLTVRTIFHLFFIDEDSIFRKGTVVDNPKYSKITAHITALNFLLTNRDYSELAIDEKKDISDAKKIAVINYINNKIQDLADKRVHLEAVLADVNEIDIEAKVESIIDELTVIELEIMEASENSRKTLEKVYSLSSRLEEASFLKDRYRALKSQYTSDIKRLKFIIDGGEKGAELEKAIKCPFCDGKMPPNEKIHQSYIKASMTELEQIKVQLEDLDFAEQDVDTEIEDIETQLRHFNMQNDDTIDLIDNKLRPRATELKDVLDSYNRVQNIRQEMATIDDISVGFSTDVFEKENEEKTQTEYNAKEIFDSAMFKIWNDAFKIAVKKSGYPGFVTAGISKDTFDAVVNGKKKKDEGKGYRAFLNTVMAFTIMKVLEDKGKYAPRMLILDSPILSLEERSEEKASDGMKDSLFSYMISNCGECQIIIAENKIPENTDYSNVNMIEFTKDHNEGRYGFLDN